MKITVKDDEAIRTQLLPLTYTRPVGALRLGISTMAERWQAYLPGEYTYETVPYLQELFPGHAEDDDVLRVAGHVVATADIARAAAALNAGQSLVHGDTVIASRGDGSQKVEYTGDIIALAHVYDLFVLNGIVMQLDFERLTSGRQSRPIDSTNTVLGDPEQVFIEEGAVIECCTLNTRQGPIYIGRDAVVMEGCHLRGPVAFCEHAQANMGCLIYGATTLGPWCKVGGEINNVMMTGFSNKGHDGFLGNAVVGEWCNLGGGTIASNLKNDYSEIKLWNYPARRFVRTGLQFCGLIMGDHSKTAINTSFNTATTVGVGCNIISEGMPRVFIPSFLKGGTTGFDNVNLHEFFAIASRVMARRGRELTDAHKRMFEHIMEMSDNFK